LRDAGQEHDALAYYRRLEKEFGKAPIADGKSIAEMLDSLPSESPLRRAFARAPGLPEGEIIGKRNDRVTRNNPYVPPFQPLDFRGPRGPFFDDLTIGYQQSGGELVARDGWGVERFRLSLNDGQRAYNNVPVNLGCVSAYGHLLVLCTGNQVIGIDTLRSAEGTSGRILWRQDIGDGNGGNIIFDPGGGRLRVTARTRNGNRNTAVGCLGPVNTNGIFVQRGRELIALDPFSGKPLWTRQVDSPNCEIFGDEEIIIVAPPEGRDAKVLVLRSVDGSLLGTCSLPPANLRWLSHGRCMLTWTQPADGKQQLKLVDPWGNRDVWSETFPADAKSVMVDDETIAVMQRDGRFVTLSLADGRIKSDEKLGAEPKLENIYVLRSAALDILVVSRSAGDRQATSRPRRNIQATADGSMPVVTGHIYAFNRATGKQQWAVPGSIEEHGLLLSQPSELPVLLFIRTVSESDGGNLSARGSILCLDKLTGRMVFEDDNLQQIATFDVTTNFDEKMITVNLLQQNVTLKFTGNPIPPEPPYQAGLSGPQWDIKSTLRGAFEKATEPEAGPVKINQDPFAPGQPPK
jgi:outer membrane protein assembly factor BamB